MRFPFRSTLIVLAPVLAASAAPAQHPGPAGVVVVTPFAVDRDSAGVLRALADTCLAHVVRGLEAQRIKVEAGKSCARTSAPTTTRP
jgi:hypothetical protein